MSEVVVRERGEEGVLVELFGEFDRHDLEGLRETLSGVAALRRPTLVDLSGVNFLDVGAARELAIRSRLYAHHMAFRNPSWQARASVEACGFETWMGFNGQRSAIGDRPGPEEDGTPPYEGVPSIVEVHRSA